jgi:anaerobic selenocysteine-containing dehydrogenase
MTRVAYVTCPLCEATCGLEVAIDGDRAVRVVGDVDNVFSRGHVCPKGTSLDALHGDPDRLRSPRVRRYGKLVESTWQEAFVEIDRRLTPVIERFGRDAVALYVGNPAAHNLSTQLYNRVLAKAVGTRNIFTASSMDQLPKHVSAGLMFGDPFSIPVPDLDRTMYLLVIGANPMASNGSLMTAPDMRRRLRALRARGGKVVVVDPRRSKTAEHADEHHAIRPGTDAMLLFCLIRVLFEEGLATPIDRLDGVEVIRELAGVFTPEAVAPHTGIPPEDIRRLARELAGAESAAVYGRMGTTTQSFGTLTSWLVDVVNALTGNLDREGGAMFPLAAAGQANASTRPSRPFELGRWHSRVRGLPEVIGELPVVTLADEILEPGEGRVRALITIAGNPCVSTPNAGRLDRALGDLEFMVSLDVYVNETTRHADVILPGPTPLSRPHYDLILYQLAVHNVAIWTPAAIPSEVPEEWRTLLRLAGIAAGLGPDPDIDALDAAVADELAKRNGIDSTLAAAYAGPERLIDLLLRCGPYELTLADLQAAPHGVDLGPLKPRLPSLLRTASGNVELAPGPLVADVPRLAAELERPLGGQMMLIGRRHLRSNNSWMHNLKPLVHRSDRCTAQVHPDDAERLGLLDGGRALVRSAAGEIEVPIEVTDGIRPGVVSIPHGWGHDVTGVETAVAAAHAGVNANLLTDHDRLDPVSATAALNGTPVELTPCPGPEMRRRDGPGDAARQPIAP